MGRTHPGSKRLRHCFQQRLCVVRFGQKCFDAELGEVGGVYRVGQTAAGDNADLRVQFSQGANGHRAVHHGHHHIRDHDADLVFVAGENTERRRPVIGGQRPIAEAFERRPASFPEWRPRHLSPGSFRQAAEESQDVPLPSLSVSRLRGRAGSILNFVPAPSWLSTVMNPP